MLVFLKYPFPSELKKALQYTNTPPYQVHKAKAEKARERILKEEMDAKRAKTKAARERRQARVTEKRNALAGRDDDDTKE